MKSSVGVGQVVGACVVIPKVVADDDVDVAVEANVVAAVVSDVDARVVCSAFAWSVVVTSNSAFVVVLQFPSINAAVELSSSSMSASKSSASMATSCRCLFSVCSVSWSSGPSFVFDNG